MKLGLESWTHLIYVLLVQVRALKHTQPLCRINKGLCLCIYFKIHLVTNLFVAKRGNGEGLRNKADRKRCISLIYINSRK